MGGYSITYPPILFAVRINSHVLDAVEYDYQVEIRRPMLLLDQHIFPVIALDVKGIRWQFFTQDPSHDLCDGVFRLIRRHRYVDRESLTTFWTELKHDFTVGMRTAAKLQPPLVRRVRERGCTYDHSQ